MLLFSFLRLGSFVVDSWFIFAPIDCEGSVFVMQFFVSFLYSEKQLKDINILLFCFVAFRPKSTAMVIAGRSVHLTTLF